MFELQKFFKFKLNADVFVEIQSKFKQKPPISINLADVMAPLCPSKMCVHSETSPPSHILIKNKGGLVDLISTVKSVR